MSWGLGRREKKKKDCPPVQFCAQSVQSGLLESRMAQGLGSEAQRRLFEQIRQAVPLVDAAIGKIIRLVGDFELECSNRQAQEELRRWCSQVPVDAGGSGLRQFLHSYLDDLLTYGKLLPEPELGVMVETLGVQLEEDLWGIEVRTVNAGSAAIHVLADGWTVKTLDGKWAAHYENTVLITDGEPEILTAPAI